MSDKQDEKKKDGERKGKKTEAMREHEHQIEHGHDSHAHNPAAGVPQTHSDHAAHEHGLQNKEVNKDHNQEVNIHSDDKNQRHTHVPKAEQMEHDLKAEEAKKK